MDYFDKKIKDIYNQPSTKIPGDLDWDFMEDGIYERMEGKKSKRRGLWFWMASGILATILIAFFLLPSKKGQRNNVNLVAQKNENTSSLKDKSIQLEKSNNQSLQEIEIATNNLSAQLDDDMVISNTAAPKPISRKKLQETNETPSTFLNAILQDKDQENVSSADEITTKNNITLTTSENIEKPLPKSNTKQILNLIEIEPIDFLANQSFLYSRAAITNQKNILIEKNTARKNNIKPNTKYSLSLLGGTNLNTGYKIEKGDMQYHSSLPGYNIRLAFEAQKENGWGYELGIGHSLLVEKFDLDLLDTIVEIKNLLVRTVTNTVSGNVTDHHDNVSQLTERYRRELSFNTINTITFDAAIFRSLELGNKWSIAPKVGLQYSRILDIKGKALDAEGEIISYNNNSASIKKNLYSGALGLRLNYGLTNQLSLSADMSQTLSINKLYADGSSLGVTYLSGGLTYKL